MDAIETEPEVILGVDTHLDCHVGVVIDVRGRVQGTLSIATNAEGYQKLLDWALSFGCLHRAGVEGTGTYGAALTRVLEGRGVRVIEVNRPDRSRRRLRGKSDPTDAESAARSVLAGQAQALPKSQNGLAEALRTLSVARRSAVKAKTPAMNQLRSLLASAPPWLRERVLQAKPAQCVAACEALSECDSKTSPELASLQLTLRLLAKRWVALEQELQVLDRQFGRLTKLAAPRLLSRFGVGPQTAATLLLTAVDNPTRLRNEAALAALCGVSPLEASSGKTQRHRLNRGGQRQANNALWTIAMVRMRSEPRTQIYVDRRTREGLSKKEIHRCLKRYIVRELYPLILADLKDSRCLT
ncbi:MAG: IS110 family transposase [Thiomonas sp. 20-64-5]|nr:MAG: IS110 family transposase [Thiomonas sp. 20-64-5]